jgi:large subunit ribosomal protein L31e
MAEEAKKVESEEVVEKLEEEKKEPVAVKQKSKAAVKEKPKEDKKPPEIEGQKKKEEAEETEEKEVEQKKPKKKREEEEKEEEEEFVEERLYTIPLRRALITPPKRKSKRAIKVIRTYIQRHLKPEGIKISEELNQLLWSRGPENPPPRIRVKALKDKEGVITVRLAEGE